MSSSPENTSVLPEYCSRVRVAIADLKGRLQERYERVFPERSVLIHKAIEEAEALAWRTSFPHLFLPELAEDRIARLALAA
ncbi:MAG TPA: hypothetical protein VIT91_12210 [Chthoniobacterales bacterium]